MDDGVFVLAVQEAEIRTPDDRILAGGREYPVGILRPLIRKGLLLGLLDHQVPMDDGVFVLAVQEAEIRTPDDRILAGGREYPVGILRPLIRKVVLAREGALARDRAQGLQQ